MWNQIKRFCVVNAKPKFISLLLALIIWLVVKEIGIDSEREKTGENADALIAIP